MEQLTAGGVDRPIQVTVEQNCPQTGGRKFILILYISSLLIIMQQYCCKLFAKFNVLLYLAFVISIVHSVLMNLPPHICWQRPMTRCGIVRPLPTLWPDGALLRLITWNNIASLIRHPDTYSMKSYIHLQTKAKCQPFCVGMYSSNVVVAPTARPPSYPGTPGGPRGPSERGRRDVGEADEDLPPPGPQGPGSQCRSPDGGKK